MEPLDYLTAVARRWRLVLACMLLAGIGAFATAPAPSATPSPQGFVTYSATATLLSDPTAGRNLPYTVLFMQRGELPQQVADALGGGASGPAVAARVTIVADDSVGSISITSTDPSADVVENLVNTYAQVTIAYFDNQVVANAERQLTAIQGRLDTVQSDLSQLDVQARNNLTDSVIEAQRQSKADQYQALLQQQEAVTAGTQTSGLSVLEPGLALEQGAGGFTPPSNRSQRLLLGLVLGGFLGALLALVIDRVDTRIRTRHEVQHLTGTAVLAEVPRLGHAQRHNGLPPVVTEPGGAFAESHRGLRSALSLLPAQSLGDSRAAPRNVHAPPSRVVLVVSGRAGEGKSTTVVNLATTVAAAGRSVVVIDADLHHPSLGEALGVPGGQGLSDLAATGLSISAKDLAPLLRPTRIEGVCLLDAGTPERFAAVSPGRMVEIVQMSRGLADVVLVDVAPLLSASDALDLVPAVDSALLVVRSGRTTRNQLAHATEVLSRTRVPVIGTVLVGTGRSHGVSFRGSSESAGRLPLPLARGLARWRVLTRQDEVGVEDDREEAQRG